jgi:hypothetical protein
VDTGRDFHRDLNRVMATINTILGLPLDTAERAALYPDTTIERESAAAIPAPTDEIVVRRELVAGADNPVAVAAIAPTISQQSSRTDVNKTIDTFRIPKSAMAIVCGCIVILGAGWWFWANNVGMAPTTNVAPQIAAPVVQSTAPVLQPTSPVPAAKSAENLDPGADVVRAFYIALSHGDGAAAAALVIPERQKGGLSAPEMTQFYSGNFQPLQLISVLPYAQNSYQATYTFQRTAKSVICANSVIISVTQRNGRYFIQGIDARGGC